MTRRRSSPSQITLGLALIALTACGPASGGAAGAGEAPRAAASTARAAVETPRPVPSPIVVAGTSLGPMNKRADATSLTTGARPSETAGTPTADALQTPPDRLEIVTVHNTHGYGVWMRAEPAGAPVKVWPEGAPMLVAGPDRLVDGRAWRNVRAVDGELGWVAADYLTDAGLQAYVQAASLLLDTRTRAQPPSASPAARSVASPTPRAAARRNGPAASGVQASSPANARQSSSPAALAPTPPASGASAAAPVAGTPGTATPAPTSLSPGPAPQPSATPIRGPAGSRSLGVGDLRLTAGASETLPDLQVGNRPRPGNQLLAVEVTLENIGNEPAAVYRGVFRLALDDGTRLEPLAGREPSIPYSASLAPGEKLHGWLTFETASGARPTAILWAPERESTFAIDL